MSWGGIRIFVHNLPKFFKRALVLFRLKAALGEHVVKFGIVGIGLCGGLKISDGVGKSFCEPAIAP